MCVNVHLRVFVCVFSQLSKPPQQNQLQIYKSMISILYLFRVKGKGGRAVKSGFTHPPLPIPSKIQQLNPFVAQQTRFRKLNVIKLAPAFGGFLCGDNLVLPAATIAGVEAVS